MPKATGHIQKQDARYAEHARRRGAKRYALKGMAYFAAIAALAIIAASSPVPNTREIPIFLEATSAPVPLSGAFSSQEAYEKNANTHDSKKLGDLEQHAPANNSNVIAADAPSEDSGEDNPWEVLNGIPQTRNPLGLPECEPVDDSYFDGTVFIGDSVTLKLQQYVTGKRKSNPSLLGGARFLAIGSLGTHSALENISEESLHPSIKGKKMTLEDALVALKAKKAYIMLGVNDVYFCGMETSIDNMFEFISRIRAKLPDIEIFIESATPRYGDGNPTTQMLFEYDLRLYEEILKLDDPKLHFVDVAYVMRDKNGKLYKSYCSDIPSMGLHFTDLACEKWIEYLYTHASV